MFSIRKEKNWTLAVLSKNWRTPNRKIYRKSQPATRRYCLMKKLDLMHQSIPPAPSSPPGNCGAFARLVSPGGGGIWKFCTAWGPGICQPPGHFRAFDTHAVFYQNITTQKVLLHKKQIGSSVKDRNKLQRVVKACSRFYMYVCISSLLIKRIT